MDTALGRPTGHELGPKATGTTLTMTLATLTRAGRGITRVRSTPTAAATELSGSVC